MLSLQPAAHDCSPKNNRRNVRASTHQEVSINGGSRPIAYAGKSIALLMGEYAISTFLVPLLPTIAILYLPSLFPRSGLLVRNMEVEGCGQFF